MKLVPKHQNGKPIKKQNWFTRATLNAAMAENPAIMTSAGWNIDSSTGEVKQDNKAFEAGSPEESLRNSLAVTSTFAPTHPLNAIFEMAPWIYRGGLYALGKAGNIAAKNRYIATSLNDAIKETTLPIFNRTTYNELPEGGQILFPLSNTTDNVATRGTVAGLQKLARDPRYTPIGELKILFYKDKNGSVKTFGSTGFMKLILLQPRTSLAFFEHPSRSTEIEKLSQNLLDISAEDFYTSLKLLVPPEYIGSKIEEFMPYSRLSDFATRNDVIPLQYVKPGKINEQWAEETIRRLKDLGYDLSDSYEGIGLDGMYNHYYVDNTKTFENFIRENSKRESVAGLTINRSDRVGGLFDHMTNISFVDPTKTNMSVPSIIFHERNMHGTDDVIRTLKAKLPFTDFTDALFTNNPRVVDGTKPFLYILDSDKSLLTEGGDRWNEARATLGELKRKYYIEIRNTTPELKLLHISDPTMRQAYLDKLNKLSDNFLLEDLSDINGYGLSYAKIIRDMPADKKQEAIKIMRNILEYGALSTLPFVFTNETNN